MSKRGIPFRQIITRPDDSYGPIHISGRYYGGVMHPTGGTDFTLTVADRLYAFPYWVNSPMVVDEIAVHCRVSQVSSNLRVGIYDTGEDGLPNKLLVESASFDTSSTGDKATAITLHLPGPRLYWACLVTDTANVAVRGRLAEEGQSVGLTSAGASTTGNWGRVDHTFAALPDPFGTFAPQATANIVANVLLKVA